MSRIAPNRLKSQLKMAAILNFSLMHDVIKFITFLLDSVTLKMWVYTPNLCFWADQRPRYEQFNFRKILMAAILKSAQKRWGRPNLYGVSISIIDQWGPLNKMIPLIEDPGGGGGGAR